MQKPFSLLQYSHHSYTQARSYIDLFIDRMPGAHYLHSDSPACVCVSSLRLSRVPLQDIYRMLYHRACEKARSSRNALANRLVNDNAPSYIWEGSPSSSPTRTQERHESPCVTIPAAWGKKMPLQGAVPASTRYSREVCLRLKRLYLPRRGDIQEKPQPAVRP